MKQIFKKGDKVFDYTYEWGTVDDIDDFTVRVKFDSISNNTVLFWGILLKTLSFTEYTLEGFSQERPEPLPKIGDIVWGKGFHTTDWSIGHYLGKQHASYKISSTPNALSYWLAFTITTKNPYKND
jgi:hypothetical protein